MNDLQNEDLSYLATLLGTTGDVRHDDRWLAYAADARVLMSSAIGATIIRTLAHHVRHLMAHDEENKRLQGEITALQSELEALKRAIT
jgi:hypothetical protein